MAKRGLPQNLYERRGYYSWRNPSTREEFGIGTNRASAIVQAVEANLKIAQLHGKPRLVDRIEGTAHSIAEWDQKFSAYLVERKLSAKTLAQYASFSRRLVSMLGAATPIKAVTALKMSEAFKEIVAEGKTRTAKGFRVYARDWFREAVVAGWRDDNPVRDTRIAVKVEVRRARLLWPVFRAVYSREEKPWARNAYALALVTAQRLEDVAGARFSDFRDGGWWLKQSSEKSTEPRLIFIPLELRLTVLGLSLQDVLSQCRRSGVLSRYLVHHAQNLGDTRAGNRVWRDTISRRFTATLASFGLDFGDKGPPTFHEIRSLSERLYADQGGVATQHLLGHAKPGTTALYHDSRGLEWTHALDGRKIVSE